MRIRFLWSKDTLLRIPSFTLSVQALLRQKYEDNTPGEVIQERFDRLAELVAQQAHDANQVDLNTTQAVLAELPSVNTCHGGT